MLGRFTVLASGSSGNSSLLEWRGRGVLIDFGLGPRMISQRMAPSASSWKSVHAAVLTHTHGDHWKDTSLAQLRANGIPLWVHPRQAEALRAYGPAFHTLEKAGLVHLFEAGQPFEPIPGLRASAVTVDHDCEPAFGYRFEGEGHASLFDGPQTWSMGYASDLGHAPESVVEAFRDVNLLALEFNHDERMQKLSRRPRHLIQRVLGDKGHLSNRQGMCAVRQILARSTPGKMRHLVLLHLSRECNTQQLALVAAREAVRDQRPGLQVAAALQDRAIMPIPVTV